MKCQIILRLATDPEGGREGEKEGGKEGGGRVSR